MINPLSHANLSKPLDFFQVTSGISASFRVDHFSVLVSVNQPESFVNSLSYNIKYRISAWWSLLISLV